MLFLVTFLLVSLLPGSLSLWHAYNGTLHKMRGHAANHSTAHSDLCPSHYEATRPLSQEYISSKKLWPGLMKDFDMKHGESLYGLQAGLDAIWKNQHPANCSEAKFLVSGGWPYGFGSRIHVEGWGLAIAMELGRVYLLHPDGDNIFWETNNPHCKSQGKSTLDCYYEPVSSCTIQDALDAQHRDVNAFKVVHTSDFNSIFDDDEARSRVSALASSQKGLNIVYTTGGGAPKAERYVPRAIKQIVDCSPMQRDLHYYWWRAVSATYFLRPNSPTLAAMKKYRDQLPLPDNEQCIAMFVRHGDKGIEMQLIDFDLYAATAKMLWEQGYLPLHARSTAGPSAIPGLNFSHSNPSQVYDPAVAAANEQQNCTIFVTTEDPAVIKQAQEWTQKGGSSCSRVMFTTLYDRATSIMQYDWKTQQGRNKPAGHHDNEYLSMLLNLEYSTRCEAWVCTMASNSCRVMDELRATLGGKANRYFADLSKETCRKTPCFGTEDAEIYNFGE